MPYRLGDDVDDYCIKCKRVTNHSIVSLLGEEPAKVRCRTCYNDHDFRRCEVPPSKKDLKKQALLQEVLATAPVPTAEAADGVDANGEAANAELAIADPATEVLAEAAPIAGAEETPKPASKRAGRKAAR